MKIAVIDSGIHPGHPHVGEISGGVEITLTGEGYDAIDRLGHGTAVAGAIREKMPDAELYAVKVFDRRLRANVGVILRALALHKAIRPYCRVSLQFYFPLFSPVGRP